MIAPRACSCGEAMQWRGLRFGVESTTIGVYLCHHCDRPCAGVAGPGRCDACDRMKVKR